MSKFKTEVIKVVLLVPRSKVVSYGQVALYVGMPRAARQVGWILNSLEEKVPVPWWRVVNNKGRISIKGSRYSAQEQRQLLESEGLLIDDDLTFDIEKYRFVPDLGLINSFGLEKGYIEMISQRVPYSKYFPR